MEKIHGQMNWEWNGTKLTDMILKVENIVYNELLIRGYNVDVGIVEAYAKNDEGKTTRKQFEVDFVVNQGSQRYYIQVAYDMTSEEKQKQWVPFYQQ